VGSYIQGTSVDFDAIRPNADGKSAELYHSEYALPLLPIRFEELFTP
jgi:hypothetical protein